MEQLRKLPPPLVHAVDSPRYLTEPESLHGLYSKKPLSLLHWNSPELVWPKTQNLISKLILREG